MRKKMILVVTLMAVLLSGVFGVGSFAWAQKATAPKYRHGWLARIISVTRDFNIIGSLPSSELANFVATKPGYRLNEYMNIAKGSPPVDYPLWKGEGYLNADEAGYYVFSILKGTEGANEENRNCSALDDRNIGMAIYVGDVVVASGVNPNYLMGATILEPALHKVEFRIFGSSGENWNCLTNFKILIKKPSDNRGLPASEVLSLPVPET